jgi:tetratricopeptide (TPR) repeat protein
MHRIIWFVPVLFLGVCKMDDPLWQVKRLARSEERGDQLAAEKQFEQVVDLLMESYNHQGQLSKRLGIALIAESKFELAISHLEKARELETVDAEVHYNLAVCYVAMYKRDQDKGWIARADEAYRLAVLDNTEPTGPLYRQSLYGYAHLLVYGKEQYEEALPLLKKYLITLGTRDPKGWFLLGRVYYLLGDYDEALNTYTDLKASYYDVMSHEEKQQLDVIMGQLRESFEN